MVRPDSASTALTAVVQLVERGRLTVVGGRQGEALLRDAERFDGSGWRRSRSRALSRPRAAFSLVKVTCPACPVVHSLQVPAGRLRGMRTGAARQPRRV